MRFAGELKVKQKEKVFCGHCARRGLKCEQRFDRLLEHTIKQHKGERAFWQVIYTSLVEEDNENKVNKLQFILCNHLWLRRGKLRLLSQRYNEWKRWKFRPQLPKFTQTHLKQRSRVGSNGPPIHKFDARESVRFWIEKGHQHAQTKTEKVSKFIERKKKEKDAKHTSRIFTKPFYAHWWVWKCNKMLGFLRLSFGTFFILPWDISSIPPLIFTKIIIRHNTNTILRNLSSHLFYCKLI